MEGTGRRSAWLEHDEQLGLSGGHGQSSVQGTAQRPLEARVKDGVGTDFILSATKSLWRGVSSVVTWESSSTNLIGLL